MYTVREITDKKVWTSITGSVLLQSWEWGEFQKEIGHKVLRLGTYKGDTLVGGAQAVLVNSALRTHVYISNGPVIKGQKTYLIDARKLEPVTEAILHYLRSHSMHRFTHYIRIDPLLIDSSDENRKSITDLGFIKAATQIQPEHTIFLDLRQKEEDLLADMTKSTRYDIKRGTTKEGITVKKFSDTNAFDIFWEMYSATFKRQKFVAYSKKYYLSQLKHKSKDDGYFVYIAYDGKKPIAATLIAYDSLSAYYLHAGRSIEKCEAGKYAPKVLLWEVIKDAKKNGKSFFNLYGIAKDDTSPTNPWNGLTMFKKGFGGTTVHYTGAYDFPLTLNYWAIRILERTRKVWGFPYFVFKEIFKKR